MNSQKFLKKTFFEHTYYYSKISRYNSSFHVKSFILGKKNKRTKWNKENSKKCYVKETLKDKIRFHLNGTSVTRHNLLNVVKDDKKLLLYILCRINEKRRISLSRNYTNEMFMKVMEILSQKESSLSTKEKLIYLCSVDNRKCAEGIRLTKERVEEKDQEINIEKEKKKGKGKGKEDNKEKNNPKLKVKEVLRRKLQHIEEKNVMNYFSRILKNRKNILEEKEIEEDVFFFLQNKINKHLNNISLYLFNVSYLNSKHVMKTDILFLFVLYLLKYIKKKIKKRMSFLQISDYVELLTSIIHVLKLKRENSLDLESNVEQINRLKIVNQNDYAFEISNSYQHNSKHVDLPPACLYNDILYKDQRFFHYYNVNEFILKKEKHEKEFYANDKIRSGKGNITTRDKKNEKDLETCSYEKDNYSKQKESHLHVEIIRVIYFTNYILFDILKKLDKKKHQLKEKNAVTTAIKFPLITNYLFECLYFDIFCNSLTLKCQHLAIFLCEVDLCSRIAPNITEAKTNPDKYNNCDIRQNLFFDYVSPSNIIQLMHLISLLNDPIQTKKGEKGEKGENAFLEKCLDFLLADADCNEFSKKDLVLLYQSVSKLLLFSKQKYLEKLNVILMKHLINFTYRDLYNIVYSLKCSEYFDMPFIEILLRHIYKLKHKYSNSQLFTIISVIYHFNWDHSIFNLLISYANNKENTINSINEEISLNNEKKEKTEDDTAKGGRKLEEDLENKERILRELSAHIKKGPTKNDVFSEADLLELNAENVSYLEGFLDENNESVLKTEAQENTKLKKETREWSRNRTIGRRKSK